MANWPSFEQHNALKERVGTLERSAIGGGGEGIPEVAYAGAGVMPGENAGPAPLDVYSIGFRLAGGHLGGIAFDALWVGGDVNPANFGGLGIYDHNDEYVYDSTGKEGALRFFPMAGGTLIVLDEGCIGITVSVTLRFKAAVSLTAYHPTRLENASEIRNEYVTYQGTEKPVVPMLLAQTVERFGLLAGSPPRIVPRPMLLSGEGMEMVWPVGGSPYLHVWRVAGGQGGTAQHFHLPLTPGLPQ